MLFGQLVHTIGGPDPAWLRRDRRDEAKLIVQTDISVIAHMLIKKFGHRLFEFRFANNANNDLARSGRHLNTNQIF